MSAGAAHPSAALSAVITPSAPTAPANTVAREWRIAMMAAMKNVLSPISLMRIIVPDFTAPSKNSAVELIVPVEAAAVRAGVSEHCENPKPQKSSAGASEIVHSRRGATIPRPAIESSREKVVWVLE